MAYTDIFNAANNATFQGRCFVAIWTAAQAIINESADTPDHSARKDWATRVLQDRANITPRQLAVQVLRNPTIAQSPDTATDGDLQFQVNSVLADIITIG
jgi:hypothetical protein